MFTAIDIVRPEGEEIVLVVGSDSFNGYGTRALREPPDADDVLVNASFAGWSSARRRQGANQFAAKALALTYVPGLLMLLVRTKRVRHSAKIKPRRT